MARITIKKIRIATEIREGLLFFFFTIFAISEIVHTCILKFAIIL